jgi:3-oxoacyl-[acyl-carrier protein] reductase
MDGWELVIHCAAVNLIKAFYKMEYSAFQRMVETNVMGTFNLLKNVIPKLSCKGSIILFSSAAAFSPTIGQSAYACCKSALHGLVRVLARELLVEDKYIFLIAPGLVETGMPYLIMSEIAFKAAIANHPMRRPCTIAEIVNTIEFARRTPYLTGQTIHLNGTYNIV